MKPITPDEVVKAKAEQIPDEVIQAFNDLIAKNWNGFSSTFQQASIAAAIQHNKQVSIDTIYKQHWMDVEDIYREAGWHVVYDKPGYNESYEATFTFSRPK